MIRKSLFGVLGLLLLIVIGLAVWEPLLATAATAPPPHAYDTRVARDRWGVPHIFGVTDADVAYGVGYAHAEDDFATLQEALAMTRGRLGAITGADGAKVDYALHLLGARATVDRDYDRQPADVRALLDAYAAGLNTYAARHPDEVRLAKLFPVAGRDIVTGFVLRMPFFFGLDATLGALSGDTALPIERAGSQPDAADPAPVPAGASVVDESPRNGSNALVVGPKRSADGATRVVSNAHQPWRGGVAWYELVIHSRTGWNFAGATFPGVPFPVLGHNRTLGWTNTVNRPDLTDLYKLVLSDDGGHYRFDGQWRPLAATRVWLPVKLWGPFVLPVPKTIYRAVQGPVIVNKSGAYAIRYAGADQLRMVEEYYRLTKARDFGEWQRALAIQGVPATNFLYGDAVGNIAYFYNASFPNRKPGFDYAHVLPGDTARDFAAGTVPWAMIPRNVNPASGFLINANNTPYQAAGVGSEIAPQPPLFGVETDTTNRGTRALELMSADPSITRQDLYRIKYDTTVSRNSWAGRWFDALIAVDPQGDAQVGAAKAVLAKWDWNYDGRGPADALAALLLRAGNKWHGRRLPRVAPHAAMREAAGYLLAHYGRVDVPLGTLLRLQQGKIDLPLDGGPDVLRAVDRWDETTSGALNVQHGDSFIMFMEWPKGGGAVRSWSIQPFGAATTRPASRHYTDQALPFARHRLKPVWFDPQALTGHVERYYRP